MMFSQQPCASIRTAVVFCFTLVLLSDCVVKIESKDGEEHKFIWLSDFHYDEYYGRPEAAWCVKHVHDSHGIMVLCYRIDVGNSLSNKQTNIV
tara:strand:- start:434 stop:712 length:279 start_codon:yes stop_codon:yes gene_type:complete